MTAVQPRATRRRSLWSQLPRAPRSAFVLAGLVMAAAVATQATEVARLFIGVIGLFVIVLITVSDRDLALKLITIWLIFLGLIRRALIPFAGWSTRDPLLLVSPAVAIVLLITGRRLGTPPRTMLSSLALFLLLWSGVQVLNPAEPDLAVAAQATLFYVTPPLWFFVGRTMTLEQHDRILNVVFWCMVPVIIHGLYQSFFRLLPFEYTWVGVSDIGPAIFLPGFVIRPFSSLTSPQEYGVFLSLGIAVIYSRILHGIGPRRWLILFMMASFLALFLQASRTTLLLCLLAVGVVTVTRIRSFAVTIATVGVAVAVVLFAFANPVERAPTDETEQGGADVGTLINHQLTGLTNPEASTAPLHIELTLQGLEEGIENPLGVGVSRGTLAVARFSVANYRSAENDVGNSLAALGVLGGLALVLFIVGGIAGARRLYRSENHVRYLIWLGFGVASIFNWLNGGLYTTTMLLWLGMGGVARQLGEQRVAKIRALAPPPSVTSA